MAQGMPLWLISAFSPFTLASRNGRNLWSSAYFMQGSLLPCASQILPPSADCHASVAVKHAMYDMAPQGRVRTLALSESSRDDVISSVKDFLNPKAYYQVGCNLRPHT